MSPIQQLQLAMGLLMLALVCLLATSTVAFLSYSPSNNLSQAPQTAPPPVPVQAAEITDPVVLQGKTLFQNTCSPCHSTSSEVVVGPGLQGIKQRRSEEWLLKWIKNSQVVVQSGDAYAVALFKKFNSIAMPASPYTEAEIKAIIKYLP